MDFADDLALLSHTREPAQAETDKLKETAEQEALKIDPGKTKIREINTSLAFITMDAKDIEEVSNFTCLKSVVNHGGGTNEDIKTRTQKARKARIVLGCCQTFGNQRKSDKVPN